MSCVNIVIRTLNEGKWLDLCLRKILRQSYQNFCVTVVDSGSDDLTLAICEKYRVNLVHIDEYRPGSAINLGILARPNCDFAVILSAHCIPVSDDWLHSLVDYMVCNENVVGAYGSQAPMNFTSFENVRDLAITFRGDTGLRNDGFFHNANSIIRVNSWLMMKFDDDIKHIEDIIWAQKALKSGFDIAYVKEARVTHYHGPNQHENYQSFRSKGLSEIFEKEELISHYRLCDLFEQSDIPIVNIYREGSINSQDREETSLVLEAITGYAASLSLHELILMVNMEVFKKFPTAIACCFYPTSANNAKEIITKLKSKFYEYFPDAVVPVSVDQGNYWIDGPNGLEAIQSNLMYGKNKHTVFKEHLLQGGIVQLNSLTKSRNFIEKPLLERVCYA